MSSIFAISDYGPDESHKISRGIEFHPWDKGFYLNGKLQPDLLIMDDYRFIDCKPAELAPELVEWVSGKNCHMSKGYYSVYLTFINDEDVVEFLLRFSNDG